MHECKEDSDHGDWDGEDNILQLRSIADEEQNRYVQVQARCW